MTVFSPQLTVGAGGPPGPASAPAAVPLTAARSHVGAVRSKNEDRWLARPHAGLWAVADGMGGHRHGDLASSLLVDSLAKVQPCGSGHSLLSAVRRQVLNVNRELRARARALAPDMVIGSTIVVLLVFDGHCAFVWAGDSRAYRLRAGRLERMTSDHRMVQTLLERGTIGVAAARVHPWAHVITRAVGAEDALELEARYESVEAGDIFLLASDGLTDVVDDQDIGRVVASHGLEDAADELLRLALERGAADNVTFVLTRAAA